MHKKVCISATGARPSEQKWEVARGKDRFGQGKEAGRERVFWWPGGEAMAPVVPFEEKVLGRKPRRASICGEMVREA